MDKRTGSTTWPLVILLAIVFVVAGVATSCKNAAPPTGDTKSPTVTVTSSTADPTGDAPIDVSIIFSESVTGFEVTDLTVVNATPSNFVPVDDRTFTVELDGLTAETTVTLDIAAGVCTDAAGNPNAALSTLFSRFYTARSVPTISTLVTDPTNASSIAITIQFTKAVVNFEDTDITATNCTVADFTNTAPGTEWTANLLPVDAGTVEAKILADVCDEEAQPTIHNAASNTLSITYDNIAPGVTDLASSAPDPTNTPYAIDITFSEAIDPASFTGADITFTAGSGSASDPTTSDNVHWTSTVSPSSEGTVTVTIGGAAVKDLAGNDSTAALGSVSRTWDITPPGVTSITSPTNATATGAYPIPCSVLFSEAIDPTTFAEGDITIGGTAAEAQVQAGSLATSDNTTWTFNLIYTGAGTITATINADAVSDPAGNANTALLTPLSRTTITTLTFKAAVSARGNTTPITTGNINAAGGTTRIAIIGVTAEKTSAIDITGVTYGGTSATLVPGSKVTYNNGSYWIVTALYYLVSPATGNKTVVASFSANPDEGKVGCVVLQDADTTSPLGAVQVQDIAGPTGTNYVLSTGITSTSHWSTIVDMFGGSDGTAATVAGGQTSRWTQLDTGASGGSSTKPLTTPEATTVGWTLSLDQATRLQHAVVEIKILE